MCHRLRGHITVATRFHDWCHSPPLEPFRYCGDFVVRPHTFLQDVEVPNRQALREITPHTHVRVSRVLLNLSTMLAFVSFVIRRKVEHGVLFSNFCNDRFKNSEPLSVCNVIGCLSHSNCVNAATNDAANLFFNGMHQAHFENTSITVRRNVVPLLDFSTATCLLGRLPLLVWTAHYHAAAFETTSHRFVKCVCILFR